MSRRSPKRSLTNQTLYRNISWSKACGNLHHGSPTPDVASEEQAQSPANAETTLSTKGEAATDPKIAKPIKDEALTSTKTSLFAQGEPGQQHTQSPNDDIINNNKLFVANKAKASKRSIQSTAAPASRTATLTQHTRLLPLRIEISLDMDEKNLTAVRDSFYEYLQRKVSTIINKIQLQDTIFTHQQAAEVTNFFFAEIMGSTGIGRANHLIRGYITHHEGEMHRGVADTAALDGDKEDCVEKGLVESWEQWRSQSR